MSDGVLTATVQERVGAIMRTLPQPLAALIEPREVEEAVVNEANKPKVTARMWKERSEQRIAEKAAERTESAPVVRVTNGRTRAGHKAWAKRKQPYPETLEITIIKSDLTRAGDGTDNIVERAARRSVHRLGMVPKEVLAAGNRIALGRKPTPRSLLYEWNEYKCVKTNHLANLQSRLRAGKGIRTPTTIQLRKIRVYLDA